MVVDEVPLAKRTFFFTPSANIELDANAHMKTTAIMRPAFPTEFAALCIALSSKMAKNSFDFSRSPERAARFGSRMVTVLQHLNAVDEDVLHSDCILVRSFVGRFVGNCLGIEDHHIGKVTL